jgi:hypothetical protein
MCHPQLTPARVKHHTMSGLESQKSVLNFIHICPQLVRQLLVGRGMTLLDEGRYDVVVKQ